MEGEGGENEAVFGGKREPYFPNSKSEYVKVLCINNDGWKIAENGIPCTGPVAGDIDEVIQSFDEYNRHWYVLERFPGNCFDAKNFAILPDATADEMQEEEREAIIM